MASYLLRVRSRFEAAHHLTSYRGAAEPVHGHSWQVEAVLSAGALDAEGMAHDFVALQRALHEIAAALDHQDINSVPPFDQLSPTTERIARWFFDRLQERLGAAPAALAEVTVWEGPDCAATYRPS
ncbi:MAG TPA: 6-carboxytetrahydropterin synthase [Thermoanaerobaculia bacterium]|nr:6-carboxytetrahydropterin synthase [Thermoanaerobaculia bacterium]